MKKISIKFLVLVLFIFLGGHVLGVTIESKTQTLNPDKNKGYFKGDVKVQVGDVVVTSPKAELDLEPATKKPSLATFFDKPYAFQIKDNKKHEVKADIIKVSLIKKVITAQGNAQMNVLEDRKPTIILTADTQEYDTNTSIMSAEGSVVVNYEDIIATSDRAYATIDKKGNVHDLKLVSRATIKQNKSLIKGDNIEYVKAKDNITATGNTLSDITFENGDRVIINARTQQYNRGDNTMMAAGSVVVKYADYIANGPKAILYINSKTQKPQKVVFIGRSKVTEKGVNSVEADRITMIMEPKQFEAVGNVKTTIDQDAAESDNGMEFSL